MTGEPLLHLARSPGRVEVELNGPEALFDRTGVPTFPHSGPPVRAAVANFMVDTVREDRRTPEFSVNVTFHSQPLRPDEEDGMRAQMSSFFANEAEVAGLGQRVNRTEALGSLRYGIPVVAVAAVFAGLLANPATLDAPIYLSQLAYLIVIVVIWVMVWDPIEKLLFDSYFIRLRIRALHKLATAKVQFAYRRAPVRFAGSVIADQSTLDSIVDLIEG